MGDDRGRAAAGLRQRQRALAQGVVRALRGGERWVGIAAGPGLDAGVEVERAAAPGTAASARRRRRRPTGSAGNRPAPAAASAGRGSSPASAADWTKRTPYSAATSGPRGSAVTMVMRSRGMAIWRRISGSTPWPMLPKPSMTRRPEKVAWIIGWSLFGTTWAASPPAQHGRRGVFQSGREAAGSSTAAARPVRRSGRAGGLVARPASAGRAPRPAGPGRSR